MRFLGQHRSFRTWLTMGRKPSDSADFGADLTHVRTSSTDIGRILPEPAEHELSQGPSSTTMEYYLSNLGYALLAGAGQQSSFGLFATPAVRRRNHAGASRMSLRGTSRATAGLAADNAPARRSNEATCARGCTNCTDSHTAAVQQLGRSDERANIKSKHRERATKPESRARNRADPNALIQEASRSPVGTTASELKQPLQQSRKPST